MLLVSIIDMFEMSVDFWSFALLYHERSNFQCNYKSKHNKNILMQSYYCLLSPICSHKWMWYYYKWTDLIILIVRNHIYVHTLQSFLCKSYLGVNDELVNESWIFFSFNVIKNDDKFCSRKYCETNLYEFYSKIL